MPNIVGPGQPCAAAGFDSLPDAVLPLIGDEWAAVVQDGEARRVRARDLVPSEPVVLSCIDADIEADGTLTLTWEDITADWWQAPTPDWFTLAPDGQSFTFSETGFYTAHPLGLLLIAGVLSTTKPISYSSRMAPVSAAYTSEAWTFDLAGFPYDGFNNYFGFGYDLSFFVVDGPGDDPSHRLGVEVDDPAFLDMQLFLWGDGAKATTIFGMTMQIVRTGYVNTLP